MGNCYLWLSLLCALNVTRFAMYPFWIHIMCKHEVLEEPPRNKERSKGLSFAEIRYDKDNSICTKVVTLKDWVVG